MAPTMHKTIVLHQCRVSPVEELTEKSLPLTIFDMDWIHFHPLHRVFFYEFPCSSTHFTNTIVPELKKSLSLTLKHYFPLAGNLVCPVSSDMPVLRYMVGDSVSLTISESRRVSDFYTLSGHQSRDADEFYPYVPELMPPENTEPNSNIFPLLALQVTLFPEAGICIGISCNHVAGDAKSTTDFIQAWASIARFGGDKQFLAGNSQPFYDRSPLKHLNGLAIESWNRIKMKKIESPLSGFPTPTHRVRVTYVLTHDDIKNLRAFVVDKRPNLVHLSSFTMACSLAWTCLVKSVGEICGKNTDNREPEYLAFLADARSRCNPPLPPTYFGNCLASGFIIESTHGELKGNEGFLIAVELIGELIRKKANRDNIFKGAEDWRSKYESLTGRRVFGVGMSTKVDIYDVDFGWGRPKKFESLSIDEDKYSMCLVKSRDFEAGLEIGISLPVDLMDAFDGFFAEGRKEMNL